MVHLVQLEVTNFFCSAAEFQDLEYHYDRLWRSAFHMFKIKIYKLMFHYVRRQTELSAGHFPPGWHELGQRLPVNHVLHKETFRSILVSRNQTVAELQRTGYKQMSEHEIELFDQSSAEEFLKSNFTLNEFVFAASLIPLGDVLMAQV